MSKNEQTIIFILFLLMPIKIGVLVLDNGGCMSGH